MYSGIMSKKEEKKSRLKTAPKSDGRGGKFLAYYPFNDQWFFTNKDHLNIHKDKFTEKEIEEIKEKFNTNLRDYEIIEVRQ